MKKWRLFGSELLTAALIALIVYGDGYMTGESIWTAVKGVFMFAIRDLFGGYGWLTIIVLLSLAGYWLVKKFRATEESKESARKQWKTVFGITIMLVLVFTFIVGRPSITFIVVALAWMSACRAEKIFTEPETTVESTSTGTVPSGLGSIPDKIQNWFLSLGSKKPEDPTSSPTTTATATTAAPSASTLPVAASPASPSTP